MPNFWEGISLGGWVVALWWLRQLSLEAKEAHALMMAVTENVKAQTLLNTNFTDAINRLTRGSQ